MEVASGKMHCSGINGGIDAGINSGAGGRRFTGYMDLSYWRLKKDKGETLHISLRAEEELSERRGHMRDYPSRMWTHTLSVHHLHLCVATTANIWPVVHQGVVRKSSSREKNQYLQIDCSIAATLMLIEVHMLTDADYGVVPRPQPSPF